MHRLTILLVSAVLTLATLGCNKAQSDSVQLTNKGMKALSKNELRKARGYFEQAVSVFPENAKAHYGLGVVLLEQLNEAQARRHLQEAATLDPSLTEAHYQLGAIALKEQKFDGAEKALTQALQQDPDHDAAHRLMGQIYEKKGKLKEAEVAYRKAVTLNPYHADAFLRLARLYFQVEAYKESVAVLREGIRLNTAETVSSPAHLSLLHNELAISLQQEGRYGEAIDELLKAVRLPGAAAEVAFNLGWAYASKDDPEQALKYFNQFIQLAEGDDPTVRVARDVAGHLRERIETTN